MPHGPTARPGSAHFGLIAADVLEDLDGLTLLQQMAAGALPGPPMAETLNFWIQTVEKGRVVFRGEPKAGFFNPLGTVHGGWAATLLDSCMGSPSTPRWPKASAIPRSRSRPISCAPSLSTAGWSRRKAASRTPAAAWRWLKAALSTTRVGWSPPARHHV